MERVCIKCGEITQGKVELCFHCGAKLNASIDVVDEAPRAETPVGTQMQYTVGLSYTLALFNLILGPISVFVAVFNPILPQKLFQVVPLEVFLGYTGLLPIVALICLALNTSARRSYNPTKHTPKNHRTARLSYMFSVWAVLVWLIMILVGAGITFYNLKVRH